MPNYGKSRKSYSKKGKKPAKKTTKKGKSKYSLNLDAKIKNAVNRTLSRNIEVKTQAENTYQDQSIYSHNYDGTDTFSIFSLNTIYNLITQSVGQGGRVGNRINLKRFTVAYCLKSMPVGWVTPENQTANSIGFNPQPMYVDVYIMRTKNGAIETDTELSDFFQFGSSSVPPSTSIEDNMLYVNKDIYQVLYHKRHALAPFDVPVVNNTSTLTSSNDAKASVVKKVSLTKYIKKMLHYNDAVDQIQDEPTSNIFMVCLPTGRLLNGPIWTVNGTPTANAPLSIKATINCMMQYTDA